MQVATSNLITLRRCLCNPDQIRAGPTRLASYAPCTNSDAFTLEGWQQPVGIHDIRPCAARSAAGACSLPSSSRASVAAQSSSFALPQGAQASLLLCPKAVAAAPAPATGPTQGRSNYHCGPFRTRSRPCSSCVQHSAPVSLRDPALASELIACARCRAHQGLRPAPADSLSSVLVTQTAGLGAGNLSQQLQVSAEVSRGARTGSRSGCCGPSSCTCWWTARPPGQAGSAHSQAPACPRWPWAQGRTTRGTAQTRPAAQAASRQGWQGQQSVRTGLLHACCATAGGQLRTH